MVLGDIQERFYQSLRDSLEFLNGDAPFLHIFSEKQEFLAIIGKQIVLYIKKPLPHRPSVFLLISVGELARSQVPVKASVQEEVW